MAVMTLNVFSVRHVNVVGAGLPVSAIVQASGVEGENIFRVQRDQVIDRLRQVPSINVTRVDASFPDTVTIYAVLRQAYVAWRSGQTTYLLDANGNILGVATTTFRPLIVSGPGEGVPSFAIMQAVRYASSILPHLPDGKLAAAMVDPKQGLLLEGQSGWYTVIGRGGPQQLGTRVATLASLLQYVASRGQALYFADLHLRYGFYCQRGGAPCRSLPAQFDGSAAAPTPGVTPSLP